MPSIAERLRLVRNQIPTGVKLVVVSKYHPAEAVMEAYNAGIRDFGENIVQEIVPKQAALPSDIRWHFIGTLQRNKVKQIIPFVSLIHSVDSPRLYEEIVKRASAIPRQVDILFQVHIAQEDTKSGFPLAEAQESILALCQRREDAPFRRVRGLMGMATNSDDQALVGHEFARLRQLFDEVKAALPADEAELFDTLSMGMSQDWPLAIEAGSNLVRIGSLIMGERQYN